MTASDQQPAVRRPLSHQCTGTARVSDRGPSQGHGGSPAAPPSAASATGASASATPGTATRGAATPAAAATPPAIAAGAAAPSAESAESAERRAPAALATALRPIWTAEIEPAASTPVAGAELRTALVTAAAAATAAAAGFVGEVVGSLAKASGSTREAASSVGGPAELAGRQADSARSTAESEAVAAAAAAAPPTAATAAPAAAAAPATPAVPAEPPVAALAAAAAAAANAAASSLADEADAAVNSTFSEPTSLDRTLDTQVHLAMCPPGLARSLAPATPLDASLPRCPPSDLAQPPSAKKQRLATSTDSQCQAELSAATPAPGCTGAAAAAVAATAAAAAAEAAEIASAAAEAAEAVQIATAAAEAAEAAGISDEGVAKRQVKGVAAPLRDGSNSDCDAAAAAAAHAAAAGPIPAAELQVVAVPSNEVPQSRSAGDWQESGDGRESGSTTGSDLLGGSRDTLPACQGHGGSWSPPVAAVALPCGGYSAGGCAAQHSASATSPTGLTCGASGHIPASDPAPAPAPAYGPASASPSMFPIQVLPDELLLQCLARVSHAGPGCMLLRGVCRRWRRLVGAPPFLSLRRAAGRCQDWLVTLTWRMEGGLLCKLFDPTSNKCQRLQCSLEAIPPTRRNFGVATVDHRIFVIGGQCIGIAASLSSSPSAATANSSVLSLSSTSCASSPLSSSSSFPSLPSPPSLLDPDVPMSLLSSMTAYDSIFDVSEDLPPLPAGGRSHFACCVAGRKIYVISGLAEDGRPTARVEVYDVDLREWADGPSLPFPRVGALAEWCGGRVIVLGGFAGSEESSAPLMSIFAHTPPPSPPSSPVGASSPLALTSDSLPSSCDSSPRLPPFSPPRLSSSPWVFLGSLPVARTGFRAAVLHNQLCIVGGEAVSVPLLDEHEHWRQHQQQQREQRCQQQQWQEQQQQQGHLSQGEHEKQQRQQRRVMQQDCLEVHHHQEECGVEQGNSFSRQTVFGREQQQSRGPNLQGSQPSAVQQQQEQQEQRQQPQKQGRCQQDVRHRQQERPSSGSLRREGRGQAQPVSPSPRHYLALTSSTAPSAAGTGGDPAAARPMIMATDPSRWVCFNTPLIFDADADDWRVWKTGPGFPGVRPLRGGAETRLSCRHAACAGYQMRSFACVAVSGALYLVRRCDKGKSSYCRHIHRFAPALAAAGMGTAWECISRGNAFSSLLREAGDCWEHSVAACISC